MTIEDEDEGETSSTEGRRIKNKHKFLIIGNCYKNSKIHQLYKVSMKDKTFTQITAQTDQQCMQSPQSRLRSGFEEVKVSEVPLQSYEYQLKDFPSNLKAAPIPFVVDTFYH